MRAAVVPGPFGGIGPVLLERSTRLEDPVVLVGPRHDLDANRDSITRAWPGHDQHRTATGDVERRRHEGVERIGERACRR